MQHTYEVRFHTGDSWGRGCATHVSFEVYGSQYNLTSEACLQQEVTSTTTQRSRALRFAAAKWRGGPGSQQQQQQQQPNGAGAPLERRNVFALMSDWLRSAGGAAAVGELVRGAEGEGGDGLLDMEEVKRLLGQAVPSVSELEAQLFVAMVDANGDGQLTEAELLQSLGDCEAIDAAVAAGGEAAAGAAAADGEAAGAAAKGGGGGGAAASGAASEAGGGGGASSSISAAAMASALEAAVRHLRSHSAEVDGKVAQMNPAGGYLTYAQLNELFQAVVPEELGGRATLRGLLSHVARTAHLSPLDPGVHVEELRRCFGLQAGAVWGTTAGGGGGGSGGPAAAAVGWVPGRRRDVFRLLRHHVKHNRGQLDELFPRGSELTVNQVRHLVRQLLDTRVGEPPLTGREVRHLMAVLDANANGRLSREEFDGGLRECRDISAALARLGAGGGGGLRDSAAAQQRQPSGTGDGAAAANAGSVDGSADGGGGGGGVEGARPGWGAFLAAALRRLHEAFAARGDEAEAAWRRHDSRGKGRIDACELRKVLLEVVPEPLSPAQLRAVLVHLDGWDPSEHGLLSRKHLLTALRGEPPPASLVPPAVVPLASVGEGPTATATPPQLLNVSRGLTAALYGGSVDAGLPGLVPDAAQWREWHGNVKTRDRPSGAVTQGGSQPPPRPGFWRAQWRWHSAWLAASTDQRRAAAEAAEAAMGTTTTTAPSGIGVGTTIGVGGAEPNGLEFRPWPPVSVASLPYIGATYGSELAAWRKACTTEQQQQPLQPGGGSEAAAVSAATAAEFLRVPPLVSPTRVVSYKAVLAPGVQLGDVDSVAIREATAGGGGGGGGGGDAAAAGAWYLDRLEVVCPTHTPPLCWGVSVRRWLGRGERLAGLKPDTCAWEEWDLGGAEQDGSPPSGPPVYNVMFYNRNLQQLVWGPPPESPLPALPGAIPLPVPIDPRVTSPAAATAAGAAASQSVGREWLQRGVVPMGVPRSKLRFLDTLRRPNIFQTTRVRTNYEIGFGGQLGVVPGQEARVRGHRCSHSIVVQTRGGFKAVDPDAVSAAPRLPPAAAASGPGPGSAVKAAGAGAGGGGAGGGSSVVPDSLLVGGGVFPGVRECVVLSFLLGAAAEELRERYLWLDGHVALDDSSGTPPAPVRFSVVVDGSLLWARWVGRAGEVARCCVPVLGCRQLQLVVETDFSGGSRAVWYDPVLLCAPLLDKALTAALGRAARENEVAAAPGGGGGGGLRVSFLSEGVGGAITCMAPASAPPAEVTRARGTASYRISVFSGPERNGGTRGRVFVRLQGRRGAGADRTAVRSPLFCVNPDSTPLKEGDKYSLLEPVTLPYMDELDSVVLQHVPAPSGLLGGGSSVGGPNDWSVQHVEVACEDSGRTWYFVAGGWFTELAGRQAAERAAAGGGGGGAVRAAPLPPPSSPSQLELLLPRSTEGRELKVVFHIISSGKGVGMGIDGDLQMVLVGLVAGQAGGGDGGYRYASLSLPGASIDRAHETRLMRSAEPLGELVSVELSCGQQGLLATRLKYIEVVRLCDGRHFLFLPPEPESPSDSPAPGSRLVLRAATQPYFRIATFTSDLTEASTDARVYVDLFGSRGQLLDLYLRDTSGDCFNEGAEDVFFFPDPGLGDLGSICVSHDDSGDSPNWHLDHVEIGHTGTGRTCVFVCKKWLGLRADHPDESGQQPLRAGVGRFGEDRVLERVLYPTHILSALKDGQPLYRYLVLFHCDSPAAELRHAAEALQLVGRRAAEGGTFVFSDIVILDTDRTDMDLELDQQYVRQVQAASRAEAQRGLEDRDGSQGPDEPATPRRSPPTPTPSNPTPSTSTSGRSFQVVVRKSEVFQSRANIAAGVGGGVGGRQVALVLHGSADSCRPILLGAENCTTAAARAPFTSTEDDVFQVTSDSPLGSSLLRADLRLPTDQPDWGILLQSVTVRQLNGEAGEPTHFSAGGSGQWLGVSPGSPQGAAGGTQALHLVPAGCCAVSFVGRALDELAALHVRHDSPRLHPGWELRRIEVLASPPPGAPWRGERTASLTAAAAAEGPGPGVGLVAPRLFLFPGSEEQRRRRRRVDPREEGGGAVSWPSDETPFIRHFLSEPFLEQPYPPQSYFRPPPIAAPQWRWGSGDGQRAAGPAGPEAEGGGGGGGVVAPVDVAATAAMTYSSRRDPERVQALSEEYRAEVAAFLEQSGPQSGGAGPGSDVFTLMRARMRAEPSLLPTAFTELDTDGDGTLSSQQVLELVSRLLPGEARCPPQQCAYAAAMVTLGSEQRMTQPQVVRALKDCRSAFKEAAAMRRMVVEGEVDWYQLAQEDGVGLEMALCRLAEQLVQPDNAAGAAEAFRRYDKDGSGHLDVGELCRALQSLPELPLSGREVRLLLAYLFHFGDKDEDLRLSVSELQTSLAPFVPRPPAEQLRCAAEAFALNRNLPALLRTLNKLQPALLPAACAQAKAAAAAGAAGEASAAGAAASSSAAAEGEVVGWVPLSLLPQIVAATVRGVEVPAEAVSQLRQLMALDSGATGLTVGELAAGIGRCAEAVKRAASIARMVAVAREEGEPLILDRDVGSAEAVLQRLADSFGLGGEGAEGAEAEAGGGRFAAAFSRLDRDGSGYLEVAELCAAVRQVEPRVSEEELRTFLAYVQKYSDKDANGRVLLEELQELLQPFQ